MGNLPPYEPWGEWGAVPGLGELPDILASFQGQLEIRGVHTHTHTHTHIHVLTCTYVPFRMCIHSKLYQHRGSKCELLFSGEPQERDRERKGCVCVCVWISWIKAGEVLICIPGLPY